MPILKVSMVSAARQSPINIISMHAETKFKEMKIRIIVNEVLNFYHTYTLFKGHILCKMTILMIVLSSVKCFIQYSMILVCYYLPWWSDSRVAFNIRCLIENQYKRLTLFLSSVFDGWYNLEFLELVCCVIIN